MKSLPKPRFERMRVMKQRGVVLFFALVSLLAIMLAAVALIRSVDTSTMIAGNLAFKQAATTSGDAGTEAAIGWLSATQTANSAKNILTDPTHALNITNAAKGYYSNADPALDLFAMAAWDAITDPAIPAITDSSGNTIRYVIQRTCRTPGVAIKDADCLFSGAIQDTNGQNIPLPQDICDGPGCPVAGQTPMIRITSKVTGPKNTVSYVQAFVY
jgi:type IV pilus assembly protein PilX